MKVTWGSGRVWVDHSGELQGEKVGGAIFDRPSSFVTRRVGHVRDYGLPAVTPFGSQAFHKDLPDSTFTLAKGGEIRLEYRIVVHPAMIGGEIENATRAFAK